ncbi:MAG: TonB-dependent receptor plug domain-containing protein [Bacteroidota bacterium]
MKRLQLFSYSLVFFLLTPFVLYSQAPESILFTTVTGVVLDQDNNPVANASIARLNSLRETETNADGTFIIEAGPGDVLRCSALFKKTTDFEVEGESELTIVMKTDVDLLDEVILMREKERELKNTAFGVKRGKSLGYRARSAEQFISVADIDMTTVFQKIPELVTVGNGTNFSFGLRKNQSINSAPVLVVLDGVPMAQNIVNMINPLDVASITVLNSLAGTVRYGSLGTGGVILIETKMAASLNDKEIQIDRRLKEQARDYAETPKLATTYFSETTPDYLGALNKASSFEQARNIYARLHNEPRENMLYFLMDCSDYFTKWDALYSYKILSEVFSQADDNPKVLKSVAYQLEQYGLPKHAKYVYERLVELQPDHAQSYRDLALIYGQTGEYELAKSLYVQMINNNIPNVDFSEVKRSVVTEFKHFLIQKKRKVDTRDIPNDFLVASTIPKTRLVLEWTDPLSEFEVQFVGPEKNNFEWNHTVFNSSEMIESEIEDGFGMREFEIDTAPNGEWLVNIKNIKTENSAGRTYVRYTFYKDYGFPSEEKKSVLIPLDKIDEKIILDTFMN